MGEGWGESKHIRNTFPTTRKLLKGQVCSRLPHRKTAQLIPLDPNAQISPIISSTISAAMVLKIQNSYRTKYVTETNTREVHSRFTEGFYTTN